MKSRFRRSLSTKIVLSTVIGSLTILFMTFFIYGQLDKKAFYDVEIEKANIIAQTVEPLIALNIYLNFQSKIEQIVQQLIQNPNILAVKVTKKDKVIYQLRSKAYHENIIDSFVVKKTIYLPNSKKKMGVLTLTYSSKNYKELLNKYSKVTIVLIGFLSILFILLSLYIKRLLSPLRKITKELKRYAPKKEIDLSFIKQNNEIGLIADAISNMQKRIYDYSKQQENINLILEKKVNAKTLELRTQLYTNHLTGLPNRLSLMNELNSEVYCGLFIIDVDDFKEINDFYGQIAGDWVLKELAKRFIHRYTRNDDVLPIHLGGDEFALLFKEKLHVDDFAIQAEGLITDIEKMIFIYENSEIELRVSIGGTLDMDRALEKADIALKEAKKGRKSFILYDEKLNIETIYKNNMEWVRKLKKAIAEDAVVPYFQPIFDNVTGKMVSCECLIRIIDGDQVLGPSEFLTIAKKAKLYGTLTKRMIEKSCKYFENIDCDFSVNLSVEDILDQEVVSFIKAKIVEHRVEQKIVFEILESEGIEQYEEVLAFIHQMKEMGCRFAIDDFGSGYSSFEYLLQLKVDYIKIDGTLIKDIDTDRNSQVVVETIVDFARKLNMKTIAEYVHNEAVHSQVTAFHVTRSQGFLLGTPQKDIKHLLS